MPIHEERNETILQLAGKFKAERIETVDHLFANIAEERQLIFDQLMAAEQRLTGVLTELRTTIDAGNQLTPSVDALAERRDLGGETDGPAYGEPTRPFDIEEYRQTLIQAKPAKPRQTAGRAPDAAARNSPAVLLRPWFRFRQVRWERIQEPDAKVTDCQ
jgi:hypothetical protein